MWNKSKPGDYTTFRTFIFGIASQSMFPKGVVYEGVSEEPLSFRGESGANDSMVCRAEPLFDETDVDDSRFLYVTISFRSRCRRHPSPIF